MGISLIVGIWLLMCQHLNAEISIAEDSQQQTTLKIRQEDFPCGDFLSQPSGRIFSPNYPGSYPEKSNCVWDIEVPNNYLVTITFGDVELEESCNLDYIDIFDGPHQISTKIQRICGNDRGSFTSTSNFISVFFSTSSGQRKRGFQAQYYSLPSSNGTFLECSTKHMTASFSKTYLSSMGYTTWNFVLNNSSCTTRENASYITANIPYNSCGTIKTTNIDTINYSNFLRVKQTVKAHNVIIRDEHFHIYVNCKLLKNAWVQTMFATHESIELNEIQYGKFHVEMSFYESSAFTTPVNSTPYYVQLNQNLYVQAEIAHADSNLVLFLENCKTSPSPGDFATLTYDLIRNGCVKDDTYTTYYSPFSYQIRFGFRSFAFVESFSNVYLKCKMVVCMPYDYSSRCNQFCLERTKRDTSSYEQKVDVILGPFQLKKEEDTKDRVNLVVEDVEDPSEYNEVYQPIAASLGAFLVVVVVFGVFVLKKRRKDVMENLLNYKM